MRILVTGHNGYIGSVLVPVLERAGHEVVGLDSDLFAACTFGNEVPEVTSLRREKSAAYSDGSTSTVRIQSFQATSGA